MKQHQKNNQNKIEVYYILLIKMVIIVFMKKHK